MLGIYCRISQEKELGKDRSIDYQKEVGIKLSKKLGLGYRVYVDEGISGTWDIDKRPQLNKMIDDINTGVITSVFVLEQSRLERNPQVRFVINQVFLENETKLYTESGEVDLDNDEMSFMGDLMSLMNSFAVKVTKRKVKAVLRKNAREGKGHGILPYGYTTDSGNNIIVDEVNSKVVKAIFNMSLSGMGYKAIAKELNDKGIPTFYSQREGDYMKLGGMRKKSDSKWLHPTVRKIIKNVSYTGVRKFGDETFEMPQIISPRAFKKVNENLKKNMNSGAKENVYDYTLNGLCTCGKCGKPFNGRYNKGAKYAYYQCTTKRLGAGSCGNLAVHLHWLEELLFKVYFEGGRLIHLQESNSVDFKGEIEDLQTRLKEIQDAVHDNKVKKSKVINAVIEGLLEKDDIRSELDGIEAKDYGLMIETEALKDKLDNIRDTVKNRMGLRKFVSGVKGVGSLGGVVDKYIKNITVLKDKEKISVEVEFKNSSIANDLIISDVNYKAYSLVGHNRE